MLTNKRILQLRPDGILRINPFIMLFLTALSVNFLPNKYNWTDLFFFFKSRKESRFCVGQQVHSKIDKSRAYFDYFNLGKRSQLLFLFFIGESRQMFAVQTYKPVSEELINSIWSVIQNHQLYSNFMHFSTTRSLSAFIILLALSSTTGHMERRNGLDVPVVFVNTLPHRFQSK